MVAVAVARERDLGLRLKRLREDAGWTQGQLGIFAAVPRGWISMVETRDAEGAPRADYVDRVARALGSDVHYLVTGEHDELDPLVQARIHRLARVPEGMLAQWDRMFGAFFSEDPPADEQSDTQPDDKRDEDGDSHPPSTRP